MKTKQPTLIIILCVLLYSVPAFPATIYWDFDSFQTGNPVSTLTHTASGPAVQETLPDGWLINLSNPSRWADFSTTENHPLIAWGAWIDTAPFAAGRGVAFYVDGSTDPVAVFAINSVYTGFFGFRMDEPFYSVRLETNPAQYSIERMTATGVAASIYRVPDQPEPQPIPEPEYTTLLFIALSAMLGYRLTLGNRNDRQ
jgi:hypothetical protein